MSDAFDAEMTAALRQLDLARFRVRQQRAAFGGVDRDVQRRLGRALTRVWNLENWAATTLLAA